MGTASSSSADEASAPSVAGPGQPLDNYAGETPSQIPSGRIAPEHPEPRKAKKGPLHQSAVVHIRGSRGTGKTALFRRLNGEEFSDEVRIRSEITSFF